MSDCSPNVSRVEMTPVDVAAARFTGGFWGPRMTTNRGRTLPSQYGQLVQTGRLAALDPRHRPGSASVRHKFYDSDIAKWLEAACYSLACEPDPVLTDQVEGIVRALADLQQADGYLNSWFTLVCPDQRWTNLRDDHELYCAGHLMEAAVAHQRATGRNHFLDIMSRYARYIGTVFGTAPGQRRGYPGHEEIELALYKLYRATGQSWCMDLCRYFINERGQGPPHYFELEARQRGEEARPDYDYCQAHVPVREQDRAVGHAVRALYLYSGMADVGREDGDESLLSAGLRLWDNVTRRQMYVTGSVGASGQGERFTTDYDLPEETSYCETCAAIGLVFWSQRLLNLYGDCSFADVMERALYNGVLSGVSLSGDRYFYVNPLASRGDHHRQEWFGCACCPPNIARLQASLGQYAYSEGEAGWIHLYTAGTSELEIEAAAVRLDVDTRYPWEGKIDIRVDPGRPRVFTLNLRLPGWCRHACLTVADEAVDLERAVRRGYARLQRTWHPGDTIRLVLDMPVEKVRAHPAVRMANYKVALQRGPVVYCLEQTDNPVAPLSRLALPGSAVPRVEWRPELLGGVGVIQSQAMLLDDAGWEDDLYRTTPARTEACTVTAVPYCVWDNREPGQMRVWLREV